MGYDVGVPAEEMLLLQLSSLVEKMLPIPLTKVDMSVVKSDHLLPP